jgi:predicted transcriptional regulator
MVAAVGLESYVALKKAGIEPDMFFGSREGVIEAAFHGRDVRNFLSSMRSLPISLNGWRTVGAHLHDPRPDAS